MKFNTESKDIILISYPSGGFGNFLYHVLTEHAAQTVKVNNKFNFNSIGNSHNTIKYTSTYFHEPDLYIPRITIDPSGNRIVVLCDNGILNDSYIKISKVFPNAIVVRAVIDPEIRPVIYQTCIVKAMESSPLEETRNHITTNWTDGDKDYSARENFTLLYHNWPFKWDTVSQKNIVNLSLKKLIDDPVATILNLIRALGMTSINDKELTNLCFDWLSANKKYFNIYHKWKEIEASLISDTPVDLTDITDLHEQGYINYCVERMYNVTIPVYDYRDWFINTTKIKEMIQCLKLKP
jgi:hypothetical protein